MAGMAMQFATPENLGRAIKAILFLWSFWIGVFLGMLMASGKNNHSGPCASSFKRKTKPDGSSSKSKSK